MFKYLKRKFPMLACDVEMASSFVIMAITAGTCAGGFLGAVYFSMKAFIWLGERLF